MQLGSFGVAQQEEVEQWRGVSSLFGLGGCMDACVLENIGWSVSVW